jgi:hypothetical protein
LRANGSRECAPDDRLREAIHLIAKQEWIASSLRKRFAFVAGNDVVRSLVARVDAAGSYFRDFIGRAIIGCRITSRGAIA